MYLFQSCCIVFIYFANCVQPIPRSKVTGVPRRFFCKNLMFWETAARACCSDPCASTSWFYCKEQFFTARDKKGREAVLLMCLVKTRPFLVSDANAAACSSPLLLHAHLFAVNLEALYLSRTSCLGWMSFNHPVLTPFPKGNWMQRFAPIRLCAWLLPTNPICCRTWPANEDVLDFSLRGMSLLLLLSASWICACWYILHSMVST